MVNLLNCLQSMLDRTRAFDFLAPLALRLYLVPIFLMAGSKKMVEADPTCLVDNSTACHFNFSVKQDVIDWFGNPLAALLPRAYEIVGLVLVTIAANLALSVVQRALAA